MCEQNGLCIMMEFMMKYNFIKYILKGAPNDTQRYNYAQLKNCDGVQLTNAQFHTLPISLS